MRREEVRSYWDDRGLALLLLGVLSGPAAWAVNQLVGYALVKPSCFAGQRTTLIAVSAITFLVATTGGLISWSCLMKLRHAHPKGGGVEDRSQMLAITGVALNALLGLLILTAASAQFLLSPCE
jgi:hypothetical protein